MKRLACLLACAAIVGMANSRDAATWTSRAIHRGVGRHIACSLPTDHSAITFIHMSDDLSSPAVIDYARLSADDERLGRYLRVILGGTVLFYGVCGTVAAAIYLATNNGWIQTSMRYQTNSSGISFTANGAVVLALSVAGPCILWGRRNIVALGGLLVRIASVVTLLAFVVGWAMYIGAARASSTNNLDTWHWLASFVAGLAYMAFPMLSGLLAKSPVFTRIKEVVQE